MEEQQFKVTEKKTRVRRSFGPYKFKEDVRKKFLETIVTNGGLIHSAMKSVGMCPKQYHNYITAHPEFKEDVEAAKALALEIKADHVEEKLAELIDRNDITAIIFYLKTRGKERGYGEKTEVQVSADKPFVIKFDREDEQ